MIKVFKVYLEKFIADKFFCIKFYKFLTFFFFKKNKFIYNFLYKLKPSENNFLNSKYRYLKDDFKNYKYVYDLAQVQCNWHYFGINLKHDVYKAIHNDIKKSKIIFDVGANYGFFSLEALSINKDCCIYAFEPNIKNFNHTKRNIIMNNINQIKLCNFGFYSSSKFLFEEDLNPRNSGMITYLEEQQFKNNKKSAKFIKGDDFIKKENLFNKNVGIIKIDVEGAEYHVLLGMIEYLSKNNPILHIEIDNKNLSRFNSSYEKIYFFLKKCGYVYFKRIGNDLNHYDLVCKKNLTKIMIT